MSDDRHSRARAASERNAARARVRRVTGIVLAASVAVAGSLAGYVSSAASGRKAAKRIAPTRTTAVPKRTTQVAVPATPAAPPLLASGSPPPSLPQSSSSDPVQAPVETQAPPVAVSGGS